jgi:hypothetical protein
MAQRFPRSEADVGMNMRAYFMGLVFTAGFVTWTYAVMRIGQMMGKQSAEAPPVEYEDDVEVIRLLKKKTWQ